MPVQPQTQPSDGRSATLESVPRDAIPMMAQVYVRVRNRLREAETRLEQVKESVRSETDTNDDPTERQVLEDRIDQLRAIVDRGLVVPISARVIVGSIVHVRSSDDGPLDRFEIVIPTDADPAERRVSFESPIGRALLGREVGDTAVVETPRGKRELKIVVVRHE